MTLGKSLVKRKETHVVLDESTLQHLLLNEHVWRTALKGNRRRRSRWNVWIGYLQLIYEKSHMHNIFPILLLIAYSLLGGLIFWSIESSHEEGVLIEKAIFITSLKEDLLQKVLHIDSRLREFNHAYQNNSYVRKLHYRGYRKFALNQLYKSVYWYTVSVFYLTEHESHKAKALRPLNPDPVWKHNMETNFGRIHALQNYTNQLAARCWEIGLEGASEGWNETMYRERLNASLCDYNVAVGLDNALTPIWTFWNAMFLAVTTYTTIGYGNITAKTKLGKLAAMVYAVIGIPLVLMILHKLGRICLGILEKSWDCIMSFLSGESRSKLTEEERISEMPLLLAIGVAFGWMFLCAAIFLRFEKDWDYFKSFYFFFCSLTTIGYGDVTPTKSEDMFIIFALVMIGLSLVSMCINVIQMKLEKLFEELLLTLMEEYSSDPDGSKLKGGQIGMMEMWRVWKKRRGRVKTPARARVAAEKASENIAKVFPFSKRRERQQLIDKMQQRLHQKDRSTQTDMFPAFLPIYEEAWTETSDIESYTSSVDHANHLLLLPDASMCGPSRCESHPVVVEAENSFCSSSSLQPTTISSSSQPKSTTSQMSKMSSLSTVSSRNSAPSARSAPSASPSRIPIDYDPNRRWTFVATGRATRGTPRGLAVPYMYTKNQAKKIHTTEMRRLMAELDCRLVDCRQLATPASSAMGSTSSEASFLK